MPQGHNYLDAEEDDINPKLRPFCKPNAKFHVRPHGHIRDGKLLTKDNVKISFTIDEQLPENVSSSIISVELVKTSSPYAKIDSCKNRDHGMNHLETEDSSAIYTLEADGKTHVNPPCLEFPTKKLVQVKIPCLNTCHGKNVEKSLILTLCETGTKTELARVVFNVKVIKNAPNERKAVDVTKKLATSPSVRKTEKRNFDLSRSPKQAGLHAGKSEISPGELEWSEVLKLHVIPEIETYMNKFAQKLNTSLMSKLFIVTIHDMSTGAVAANEVINVQTDKNEIEKPPDQASSQGGCIGTEAAPEEIGSYMGGKVEEKEEGNSSFQHPPNQNLGYAQAPDESRKKRKLDKIQRTSQSGKCGSTVFNLSAPSVKKPGINKIIEAAFKDAIEKCKHEEEVNNFICCRDNILNEIAAAEPINTLNNNEEHLTEFYPPCKIMRVDPCSEHSIAGDSSGNCDSFEPNLDNITLIKTIPSNESTQVYTLAQMDSPQSSAALMDTESELLAPFERDISYDTEMILQEKINRDSAELMSSASLECTNIPDDFLQ